VAPARGTGAEVLREHGRTGSFAPVYYLFGEEEFLLQEELAQLVESALGDAERGFNYDVVDGAEADPKMIATLASTFPMMAERRVVVVRQADKIRDAEILDPYLDNPSTTSVVLFTARKPDKRRSSHLRLKKKAFVVEFTQLSQGDIPRWIIGRAKSMGRSIDNEGAALLADYTGTDLREIHNELEKLFAFAGERATLNIDDVQAVSGMSREINLYELHRTLGTKDSRRSMEIIARLMESGQPPIRIAVSLGYFFINLRKMADARRNPGGTELRFPPFVMKQYRSALAHYSDPEIENALIRIAIADEHLKSSSLPPAQIMHFLIASILSGEGNSLAE